MRGNSEARGMFSCASFTQQVTVGQRQGQPKDRFSPQPILVYRTNLPPFSRSPPRPPPCPCRARVSAPSWCMTTTGRRRMSSPSARVTSSSWWSLRGRISGGACTVGCAGWFSATTSAFSASTASQQPRRAKRSPPPCELPRWPSLHGPQGRMRRRRRRRPRGRWGRWDLRGRRGSRW